VYVLIHENSLGTGDVCVDFVSVSPFWRNLMKLEVGILAVVGWGEEEKM
jgi:hypothetical protein